MWMKYSPVFQLGIIRDKELQTKLENYLKLVIEHNTKDILTKTTLAKKYKEYKQKIENQTQEDLMSRIDAEIKARYDQEILRNKTGLTKTQKAVEKTLKEIEIMERMLEKKRTNLSALQAKLRESDTELHEMVRETKAAFVPPHTPSLPSINSSYLEEVTKLRLNLVSRFQQVGYSDSFLGYHLKNYKYGKADFPDVDEKVWKDIRRIRNNHKDGLYLRSRDRGKFMGARNFNAPMSLKEEDMRMEIHLVCHSHMDLGWIKTYEIYQASKLTFFLQ